MSYINDRLGQQNVIKVISSSILAPSSISLSDLSDVNVSSKSDGAILGYNGSTNKWEATLIIDGGNY